ncbi:hypothetical protein [Nocardiopsis sp. MG754419]|uniref:hypothetical protein n=1 Tax=Nocardiopsis sp. MG754419 TaxID=2259865 RepID=UPI001BA8FDB5|nr:hypothetical protein [Nocardiopsis sp. MG754419]MBR8743024.1 hypothetical protein [Nocardiopsis sp. MG754419]
MIDPSSFGTAIITLGVCVTVVIAFGLAALSDMAMRRREDRRAAAPGPDDGARDGGSTRDEAPTRTRELVSDAPASAAANGSSTG